MTDASSVRRVLVERTAGQIGTFSSPSLSHPDVTDLAAHGGLAGWAAYSTSRLTLGTGAGATKIPVEVASHGFFPLLGVTPALGRFFGPEDDRAGAAPVAVVSHAYWRSRMGGGPDALGRTLTLGGEDFTVVGVAPRGFTGALGAPPGGGGPLRAQRGPGAAPRPGAGRGPARPPGPPRRTSRRASRCRPLRRPPARVGRGARLPPLPPGRRSLLLRHHPRLLRRRGTARAVGTGHRGGRRPGGAAKGRLLADVVGAGARLTLLGVAGGIALALLLGRFAEPLLFHVSPRDPLVLAVVAATLVAVGLAASVLPGLRATRVDPMDALRVE